MRKLLLSFSLLAAIRLSAAEIPVGPSDLATAYAAAADGDVLVLEAGAYGGTLTFPTGKTITLKAAPDAEVNFAGLFRANDASLTGGGIILDGLKISITDSYFINLDKYGDITTLTMRNCDIANIARCFLRTSSTGNYIYDITFDNCVIHDCGNGGWNFMYPKHVVKSVTTTNCTLYNYANGESFFMPQTISADTDLSFTFSNNTVYRWGKSNDRALAKTEKKYSANSTYTFTDNIIYKGGNDGIMPYVVHAAAGKLVAKNNLVVEYGDYNINDKTVDDLTLAGLGLEALSFANPDEGDFTVASTSPLATASTTGGVIGDPRWLKEVTEAVQLTVTASPAEGGSVSPAQAIFNAGENAVVTARANYGFRFKEWQDAAGNAVSTENPYSFDISENTELTGVFSTVDTYTLTVNNAGDGAKWGKVKLTPEPVNGIYETGTDVTISIVPNSVTNFLYWEDGDAAPARVVKMNADKTVEATFDVVPFIVAWDFPVSEPRGNRPADYAFTTDNTGLLNIHNGDGSTTNWGGSTRNFGTGDINCIRRYTNFADMANPRSFVARFNTKGYTNVRVHALAAADNDCVHSVQKIQYSTDGNEYIDLGTLDMTKNQWLDFDATLPEGLETVYVRWIGDTSSALLGTSGGNDTEGFYLADIVVYADKETVNDTEAPILLASSPAAGSTNVSARGNFVLSFNERVKAGTGDVTLGGIVLEGIYGSKTVTFPSQGLDYGTTYVLDIPAGAITDMSGNEFTGASIEFSTMERPHPEARTFDAVVAQDGSGDYTTVQAAIDAAPEARITPYLIFVKNGEYEELVKIPASKPFIHLIGQNSEKTVIKYWINNGGSSDIGWEYSTNNPASKTFGYQGVFQVDATDFYAENISFINSYGVEKQAGPMGLAMRTCNDRLSFNNCKFRSYQDTWFTTTTNVSDRHYVNNCLIEGAVDYFYGAGDVYVENSTFRQARASGSVIVAPCHKEGTKYGYVIDRCVLDGEGSQHKLGRAWQNEPMAVFLNTTFKTEFAPEGWSEWHIAPKLFAEYNSVDADGNPIDLTARRTEYKVDNQTEKAKRQAILSDEEAARYTYENVVSGNDDWNPRKFFEAVDAPANLMTDAVGNLIWDASDYAICYMVIDGNDNVVAFTTGTEYKVSVPQARSEAPSSYKVKAVNEYGSLSEASIPGNTSGIAEDTVAVEAIATVYYNAMGVASDKPFNGFNIVVETLSDGSVRTTKAILK